jgi:hypothetical protein
MNTNEFISHLESRTQQTAKRTPSGWQVRCPGHEDRNASLSIREGTDGRVLLKCHAGCQNQDIVSALGLKMADLFPKVEKFKTNGRGKLVEAYPYRNETGSLLFEVLRFENKEFPQRRPDGIGKWIWNLQGVNKVLFRLPEIIADIKAGHPVFICEGEKDCLALVKHGFSATCNSGGASKPGDTKWLPDYNVTLTGADVVILPDKDGAGRIHAANVATNLQGKATRVRLVELPDTNGKPVKDAHDYFTAGGTADDLQRLVDIAEDWTPPLSGEPTVNLDPAPPKVDRIFILPNDHLSFTDAAKEIFSAIAPTGSLFCRGRAIMEKVQSIDGPALEIVTATRARSLLEGYGRALMAWRKNDNGELSLCSKRCPEETAKALLSTREATDLLPRISLITRSPVIIETGDGPKVLTYGYHPEGGGVLVTGKTIVEEIGIGPAVDLLSEILADFDFVTGGDRSRAIAAMITPALRMGGWLRGPAPVDVGEADLSQSGKGYRHKLIRAIYREQAYGIAQRAGGVGSLDESLSAALLSGCAFIALDNLRGLVDSKFLEMVLTWGEPIPVRVPHRGEVSVPCDRVSFQMTSNGIESTPDMANRSSIVRIKKRSRDYTFRSFPEGDLLAHVEANQGRFLGAVFSVIKAWSAEDKPTKSAIGHDFRQWSGTLSWIVEELFHAAPLLQGHESAQERVSNPALSWLRRVALTVKTNLEMSASQIYNLCDEHGIEIPGCRAADDERGVKLVGVLLARCFKTSEKIELDGMIVEKFIRFEYKPDRQENIPVKRYIFTK